MAQINIRLPVDMEQEETKAKLKKAAKLKKTNSNKLLVDFIKKTINHDIKK
jgi:hypothetical protein